VCNRKELVCNKFSNSELADRFGNQFVINMFVSFETVERIREWCDVIQYVNDKNSWSWH